MVASVEEAVDASVGGKVGGVELASLIGVEVARARTWDPLIKSHHKYVYFQGVFRHVHASCDN